MVENFCYWVILFESKFIVSLNCWLARSFFSWHNQYRVGRAARGPRSVTLSIGWYLRSSGCVSTASYTWLSAIDFRRLNHARPERSSEHHMSACLRQNRILIGSWSALLATQSHQLGQGLECPTHFRAWQAATSTHSWHWLQLAPFNQTRALEKGVHV